MLQPKFVITGLPRSRTAWLAALFATPAVPVYHDVRTYPPTGTHYAVSCPTVACTPDWKDLPHDVPAAFIMRDPAEAKAAQEAAYGVVIPDRTWAAMMAHANDFIARRPATAIVSYSALNKPEVIQRLAEYLIGRKLDERRIATFQSLNITQHVRKAQAAYPKPRLVDEPGAATGGDTAESPAVEPARPTA